MVVSLKFILNDFQTISIVKQKLNIKLMKPE